MTLGGGVFGAELVDRPATWTLDGEGEVFALGELFVAVATSNVFVLTLFFHLLQNLCEFW